MESVGRMLEETLAHYEKREYGEALILVDKLLAANPNFHRGWFLKGIILEETGKKDEAEQCYQKAGNLFTLMFRLAMQLQNVDAERALIYYERVSLMDPQNNLVWYNKGLLHEKRNELDKARECFRNLEPVREIMSRIAIPLGFMIFLISGGIMMVRRDDKTFASIVFVSAVFCLFWLKRDGGKAIRMLMKKSKYS
jgi:tetratricopeptide (TPR) repeat protein